MRVNTKRNILIVYSCRQVPLRGTAKADLFSFRRYVDENVFYLNAAVRSFPRVFARLPFDLIVFDSSFFSGLWSPKRFAQSVERFTALRTSTAVKVALPQDEFINTDVLCDVLRALETDCVFSVAPESEWPKIYPSIDRTKVRFFSVLTGYLDEGVVAKIASLDAPERTIDVGYRAYRATPSLGRHGFLKTQIAKVFQEAAPREGLTVDISNRHEDAFVGDGWYRFLLRCKYTIGVEGGSSVLDRDGSITKKTEEYLAQHPGASFEEVEAACFPGLDGQFRLFALSPRHLEACATRTCQILIEGDYNGILTPWKHYIPLERDFGNLDEVLRLIKEDTLRADITENAYRDIVASGAYSYSGFANSVVTRALGPRPATQPRERQMPAWGAWYARLAEALSWVRPVIYGSVLVRAYYTLCRSLPPGWAAALRRARKRRLDHWREKP
jgi:hypothetical protein